jgi:hypothetical protein
MVDDDDPKTGPATAPPAEAPAETEDDAATEPPEGEQPEGGDAETQASSDAEGEVDELDDDEGDEGEDGKKPSSRAARYRRQAERLRAENQALRNRDSGGVPPMSPDAHIAHAIELRVIQEIGPPPDPNDPKYKDNYVRLERELQAWENDRRAVTRDVRRDLTQRVQREQDHVAELVADHKERVAKLRTKVKDFDTTMARATVPVAPHVERLILESPRSDRIMWHLAVDQAKLVKLNNSSPEAVARALGQIEGRLSLPQAKQQTKARPPIKPLRGSGTSPPSGLAAVNAYIKGKYGDRHR